MAQSSESSVHIDYVNAASDESSTELDISVESVVPLCENAETIEEIEKIIPVRQIYKKYLIREIKKNAMPLGVKLRRAKEIAKEAHVQNQMLHKPKKQKEQLVRVIMKDQLILIWQHLVDHISLTINQQWLQSF
jgi:hypothetical protein